MNQESMDYFKKLYTENSRIPKRYLKDPKKFGPTCMEDVYVFEKLQNIRENIERFVKEGNNLLISSNYIGNGKTTWATKIVRSYIDNYACKYAFSDCHSTPVLYINVPEYLSMKKRAITDPSLLVEVNRIEDCIYSSRIVLFDDIATKLASEYDNELLYCYVNSRTNNLLTSIYTTNISKDDLRTEMNERLADRIVGYAIPFELKGVSMRGVKF